MIDADSKKQEDSKEERRMKVGRSVNEEKK